MSQKKLLSVLRAPQFVDGVFVFLLGLVSFAGFQRTFSGEGYLFVGLAGLIFGILLAWLAVRLRQPLILLCVLTVVAFFLLGGAMTAPSTMSSALPVPDTLNQLANTGIHGWRELVTTLPPIDGGVLLALPYLLGLVAGAVAMTLALRMRSAMLPALPMLGLLGSVIVLGSQTAANVALVGSAFGLFLIGWVVLRGRRLVRKTRLSGAGWRARGLAALMCAAAVAGAALVGPSMPGVGDRYVLRNELTPPFNIGQYPSPLAGFRKYTPGFAKTAGTQPGAALADQQLFSVTGLPNNARMQIATMDCYDGLVWSASTPQDNCNADARNTFQLVGHTIDNPSPGQAATITVSIKKAFAGSVWLPTAGNLTGINFDTATLDSHFDDLRYNLDTGTAVVPATLQAGDKYTFTTHIDDATLDPGSTSAAWPGPMTTSGGERVQASATLWSGGSESPVARVLALAKYFKTNGKYTDGDDGAGTYMAGHSLRNLVNMTSKDQEMAGDDEQYAAMMALMGNQLGAPTRVVMGVQATTANATGANTHTFQGKDVHAWVQVRLASGAWEDIPSSEFVPDTTNKPHMKLPQTQEPTPAKAIPPPAPVRPPSNLGDPLSEATNFNLKNSSGGFHVPAFVVGFFKYIGIPFALIAAVIGAIILAKSQRRKLRRTRGTAVARISAAWRELLDQARDQGRRITVGLTRREQANLAGVEGFGSMARAADAHVFGEGDPGDEDAVAYWAQVDEMRKSMSESLPRWARWRSALNLSSFLPLSRSGVVRED